MEEKKKKPPAHKIIVDQIDYLFLTMGRVGKAIIHGKDTEFFIVASQQQILTLLLILTKMHVPEPEIKVIKTQILKNCVGRDMHDIPRRWWCLNNFKIEIKKLVKKISK